MKFKNTTTTLQCDIYNINVEKHFGKNIKNKKIHAYINCSKIIIYQYEQQ